MSILLNHICVISTSYDKVAPFILDAIGGKKHSTEEHWLCLGDADHRVMMHIIEIEDAVQPDDEDWFHYYRHFAFEVPSLEQPLKAAHSHGLRAFMMDTEGNEQDLPTPKTPVDFGIRTVFVKDHDGNLYEFAQRGVSWDALWTE